MNSWNNTADIVIIGGGILGISTAYYLAKRDQKNIVLLEKSLLAQESTGLCVGGVRQQFSHPANIRLSQETVALFEQFKEEFHVDIGFHQVGYLFLAQKKETWKDFLASVELQKQLRAPVEILSPDEIKYRWPYLCVKDLCGGTFGSKDGYADPYSAAMAFANAAKKLGVRILEKTKATRIHIRGDRIKGIETTSGEISSPIVVNTAGPWGGEIARLAGLEFPVLPYRRQVFMTKPFYEVPHPIPMIIDFDPSFYFRGEKPGLLMGMSDPDEPSSFNTHVDQNFLEKIIEIAILRSPVLEETQILRGWSGLYSITPDENPIVGAIPEIRGLYCAIGFSGHGFQHGPPIGRILSELILDGHTHFDLTPFSPNRFNIDKFNGEKRTV